jgi:hypothetical protein
MSFLGHDRDYHRRNDDREKSKIIQKKNYFFHIKISFKVIVVEVLFDHSIPMHQLDKNPNENHLVQAHHHHVVHLDRMFNFSSNFFFNNKIQILSIDVMNVLKLHLFNQLNKNKLKLYLYHVYKFLLS